MQLTMFVPYLSAIWNSLDNFIILFSEDSFLTPGLSPDIWRPSVTPEAERKKWEAGWINNTLSDDFFLPLPPGGMPKEPMDPTLFPFSPKYRQQLELDTFWVNSIR